jgi:uncharacterized protein YqfB (UPF0267 family)
MSKHIFLFIFSTLVSCGINRSVIKNNVDIEVYTYEEDGKTLAAAMPKLSSDSELNPYRMRFDYLLINVPEIHSPSKAKLRKEIWSFYPDTIKLKRLYLKEYIKDERLRNYFEISKSAISNKPSKSEINFATDELMEVASKFFYCDQVFADTTVQSHVCIGLNGVSEAHWEKDYTLLEAFCYEGIFNDFDKELSPVDESYSFNKREVCLKYKSTLQSFDQYLLDVRKELFTRMKNDSNLRKSLLSYYEQNKDNLPFRIID